MRGAVVLELALLVALVGTIATLSQMNQAVAEKRQANIAKPPDGSTAGGTSDVPSYISTDKGSIQRQCKQGSANEVSASDKNVKVVSKKVSEEKPENPCKVCFQKKAAAEPVCVLVESREKADEVVEKMYECASEVNGCEYQGFGKGKEWLRKDAQGNLTSPPSGSEAGFNGCELGFCGEQQSTDAFVDNTNKRLSEIEELTKENDLDIAVAKMDGTDPAEMTQKRFSLLEERKNLLAQQQVALSPTVPRPISLQDLSAEKTKEAAIKRGQSTGFESKPDGQVAYEARVQQEIDFNNLPAEEQKAIRDLRTKYFAEAKDLEDVNEAKRRLDNCGASEYCGEQRVAELGEARRRYEKSKEETRAAYENYKKLHQGLSKLLTEDEAAVGTRSAPVKISKIPQTKEDILKENARRAELNWQRARGCRTNCPTSGEMDAIRRETDEATKALYNQLGEEGYNDWLDEESSGQSDGSERPEGPYTPEQADAANRLYNSVSQRVKETYDGFKKKYFDRIGQIASETETPPVPGTLENSPELKGGSQKQLETEEYKQVMRELEERYKKDDGNTDTGGGDTNTDTGGFGGGLQNMLGKMLQNLGRAAGGGGGQGGRGQERDREDREKNLCARYPGTSLKNGQCVCAEGRGWDGRQCVENNGCAKYPGTRLVGNRCECESGARWDGRQCVGGTGTNDGTLRANVQCSPQVAEHDTSIALVWSCENASAIRSDGFDAKGKLTGTSSPKTSSDKDTQQSVFGITCIKGGVTQQAACTVQLVRALIFLAAIPGEVAAGEPSKIAWVTASMKGTEDACTVTVDTIPEFKHVGTWYGITEVVLTRTSEVKVSCTTTTGAKKDEKIRILVK